MSGGVRTFRLANGGYADVPEDKIEQWMQRMDQRGIGFETAEVTADMQVGEPEVIKSGPAPMPEPPQGALSSLLDTGRDALRGLNSGLYWRGSDEVAAGGRASPLGDMPGDYRGALDVERAENEAARARSPWAFTAAETAGFVPGMFLGGARAAAGALGAIKPMAGQVAEGLVGGALGSDSGDTRETLSDAASGGLTAGMFGLVPQLGALVGRGVRGAGDWLGQAGHEVRNAALGGTASDFQKLARTKGLDYVEGGPGAAAERLGLTNRVIPQSPSAYARKADAARQGAGERQRAALTAAGEELSPDFISRADLQAALQARGREALTDAPLSGPAQQRAYARLSEQAGRALPEHPTPLQLNAQKSRYYDEGYKAAQVSDLAGSDRAEVARGAGRAAKEQLEGALDHALPETRDAYLGASRDYGEASTIGDMARNRAAANQAAAGGALPALIGGGLGGAITRDPLGAIGGAALGSQALKLGREYGPDLGANALLLGRDAARGAGGMAANAGDAGSAFANQQGMGAAVGGMGRAPDLAQVAMGEIEQGGGVLGTYRGQFAEAMTSQEPGAVQALIARLVQTDPQFRTNILPLLKQRGATQ